MTSLPIKSNQNFVPIKFNLGITFEIILCKITSRHIYISAIDEDNGRYLLIRVNNFNQTSNQSLAFVQKQCEIKGEVIDFNEKIEKSTCVITTNAKDKGEFVCYQWNFSDENPRELPRNNTKNRTGNSRSYADRKNPNNRECYRQFWLDNHKYGISWRGQIFSCSSSPRADVIFNSESSISGKPTGILTFTDQNLDLILFSTKSKLFKFQVDKSSPTGKNRHVLQEIYDVNLTEENNSHEEDNFNLANGSYRIDGKPQILRRENFSPTENCLYEDTSMKGQDSIELGNQIIWNTCRGIYKFRVGPSYVNSQISDPDLVDFTKFYDICEKSENLVSEQENLDPISNIKGANSPVKSVQEKYPIKSMAVTSHFLAALFEYRSSNTDRKKQSKIVIYCLLNNKITSILDVAHLHIQNLLSSNFYYNLNNLIEPMFTTIFWASCSKKQNFIMFDGKKAAENLWKIALSKNDSGLARHLLVGYLDNENDAVQNAIQKIEFSDAENSFKSGDYETAVNLYIKVKDLAYPYIYRKFMENSQNDDKALEYLLTYTRYKLMNSKGEDLEIQKKWLVHCIKLYVKIFSDTACRASIISSSENEEDGETIDETTCDKDRQQALAAQKQLHLKFQDFNRNLLDLEQTRTILFSSLEINLDYVNSIYKILKLVDSMEPIIDFAKSIQDYETVLSYKTEKLTKLYKKLLPGIATSIFDVDHGNNSNSIDYKIYKNLFVQTITILENSIDHSAMRNKMKKQYWLILYNCATMKFRELYLFPMIIESLEEGLNFDLSQILYQIASYDNKINSNDDLARVLTFLDGRILKDHKHALDSSNRNLIEFTVLKLKIYLFDSKILETELENRVFINLEKFNDQRRFYSKFHRLINVVDKRHNEKCQILIRCLAKNYQESLEIVRKEWELGIDILSKLDDCPFSESFYHWQKLAKTAIELYKTSSVVDQDQSDQKEQDQKQQKQDLLSIINQFTKKSKNLLTVEDFLPWIDHLSDQLKNKLVEVLEQHSDEINKKRNVIQKNSSFLNNLIQSIDRNAKNLPKTRRSNVSRGRSPIKKSSKYGIQFPTGSAFNDLEHLKDEVQFLYKNTSLAYNYDSNEDYVEDCPYFGAIAAKSILENIDVVDEF